MTTKIGNVADRQMFSPDDMQAIYWNAPIKRLEAQKIFDEFAAAIQAQAQGLIKLDLIISYLMDRFSIKPEEVTAWVEEKKAEVEAQQAALKARESTSAAETPKLIVEA
jgi:hypothetical protein